MYREAGLGGRLGGTRRWVATPRVRRMVMCRGAGQRGETTRHREAVGHELLLLMAAREGIGHILFHQAPPYENSPLHARPASELSIADLVC